MTKLQFIFIVKGLCPGLSLVDMIKLYNLTEDEDCPERIRLMEKADSLRAEVYKPFTDGEILVWANRIPGEARPLDDLRTDLIFEHLIPCR